MDVVYHKPVGWYFEMGGVPIHRSLRGSSWRVRWFALRLGLWIGVLVFSLFIIIILLSLMPPKGPSAPAVDESDYLPSSEEDNDDDALYEDALSEAGTDLGFSDMEPDAVASLLFEFGFDTTNLPVSQPARMKIAIITLTALNVQLAIHEDIDLVADAILSLLTWFTPLNQEKLLLLCEVNPLALASEERRARRVEAEELAALPAGPLSYEAALRSLPAGMYEEDLIQGGFGHSVADVAVTMRNMAIDPAIIIAIMETLQFRRDACRLFMTNVKLCNSWRYITAEDKPIHCRVDAPRRQRSKTRYERRTSLSAKYASLSLKDTSLSGKMREKMNAAEIYDFMYTELIMKIIRDAISLFEELELQVFPRAPHGASHKDIARIYGPCMTRKLKGGQLRYKGCHDNWRRVVRVLDLAIEFGRLDLILLMNFLDTTKMLGRQLSVSLRWAAIALGVETLQQLGDEPTLKHYVPNNILGEAAAPGRDANHAEWVSDELVCFIMDLCHHSDILVAMRAMFLYIAAICGLRFSDVQFTLSATLTAYAFTLTLLFEKNSTAGSQPRRAVKRVTTMPAIDYKGRSLRRPMEALLANKGKTFLLADSLAIREAGLRTPVRTPQQRCTRDHAVEMLAECSRLFDAELPAERAEEKGRFANATLHSFKGWLNTFAQQAHLDTQTINFLMHWDAHKLDKRYHRAYDGSELTARIIVLRLLASRLRPIDDPIFKPWYSRPEGSVPLRPPDLSALPLLPGEVDLQAPDAPLNGAFRF